MGEDSNEFLTERQRLQHRQIQLYKLLAQTSKGDPENKLYQEELDTVRKLLKRSDTFSGAFREKD